MCLYIGWTYAKTEFGNGSEQWNREHTSSKSHGDFWDVAPAETDLHYLRLADASVNTSKNNRRFVIMWQRNILMAQGQQIVMPASTDWHNAANWIDGGSGASFVPDVGCSVTIDTEPNNVVVAGEAAFGRIA